MAATLKIAKDAVNVAGLYEALGVTLTGRVVGIGTAPGVVLITFVSDPTPAEREAVAAIVEAHNPAALTTTQALDRAARLDADELLAQIVSQQKALTTALEAWDSFTAAQVKETVRRLVQIQVKELGVLALLIRQYAPS